MYTHKHVVIKQWNVHLKCKRGKECYLHMSVNVQRVTQVTGIYIHQTIKNIKIWGDLLS